MKASLLDLLIFAAVYGSRILSLSYYLLLYLLALYSNKEYNHGQLLFMHERHMISCQQLALAGSTSSHNDVNSYWGVSGGENTCTL